MIRFVSIVVDLGKNVVTPAPDNIFINVSELNPDSPIRKFNGKAGAEDFLEVFEASCSQLKRLLILSLVSDSRYDCVDCFGISSTVVAAPDDQIISSVR